MSDRQASPAAVQATLIGAMAIWGLNVAAVKVLTGVFDPTTVAALRMLVACAALSLIVLWKRCGLPMLSWRQSVAIVVCAILMVYLNQILFAEGLLRSTATNGALIMALSPLVSALLAAVAFRNALGAFGWVKRHYTWVMRIGGGMMIVTGLLLLTGDWENIVKQAQTWSDGFTVGI